MPFLPPFDCEFLVSQAVLAPSGHNTQPWLFQRVEGGIAIRPDMRRALPVDADGRELFASLGCAVENLCIAAAHTGYDTRVQVDEASGRIHIKLHPQAAAPQPLMVHIGQRQTNRSRYTGMLDASIVSALQNTPAERLSFNRRVRRAQSARCRIRARHGVGDARPWAT